jgi:hypothetical protein
MPVTTRYQTKNIKHREYIALANNLLEFANSLPTYQRRSVTIATLQVFEKMYDTAIKNDVKQRLGKTIEMKCIEFEDILSKEEEFFRIHQRFTIQNYY